MTLSATPHRLGLLRDIDHAAAALPDLLQQLVAPERLAHRFVGSVGEIELDRRARGFGLCGEQCFRLLVRGEQGFKALAQRRVAFAFTVEPRRALGGWFRQHKLEQEFFAGRIHGCLGSAFALAS